MEIVDEHLFPNAHTGFLSGHVEQKGLGGKVAVRHQEEGRSQGHQKSGQCRQAYRYRQLIKAEAGHLHDGPFIVAGKSSQPDQNRDQQRYRNREHEKRRDQEQHQKGDLNKTDALVDHQVHDLQDFAHQQNEGEHAENHAERQENFL